MTHSPMLRSVSGGAEPSSFARTVRRQPSLLVRPFRPGEIPVFKDLDLGVHANAVHREAELNGVPTELYLRLAVEAGRHVKAILRHDIDQGVLANVLTRRAAAPADFQVIEGHALAEYARALRAKASPGCAIPETKGSMIAVALSSEMATSWGLAAAESATPLVHWAIECKRHVPVHVVKWEAAAAESGQTLGEWILSAANALR